MLVHLDLADEIAALGLEPVAPHRLEAGVPLRVGSDGKRRNIDVSNDDISRLARFEPEAANG